MLQIGIKKTLKFNYKVNVRKASAVIISGFATMLFANQRKLSAMIDKTVDFIKDFKSCVRNGRTFDRNFHNSKHPFNYKHNVLSCLS